MVHRAESLTKDITSVKHERLYKQFHRLIHDTKTIQLPVDRPVDRARLVLRALWPEREWLQARYGGSASRWAHLWRVLRRGSV